MLACDFFLLVTYHSYVFVRYPDVPLLENTSLKSGIVSHWLLSVRVSGFVDL